MDIDYQHFRNIYSTNTWAIQNAPLLSRNNLTVVSADEQSAGRGRYSNKWLSPPLQNIYATFCLFLPQSLNASNLPQVLALTVIEVLAKEGLHLRIKWPNDLYVNKKKIGGILSETLDFGKERFIAMGLGLNVNMTDEIAKKIDGAATSVLLETGKEFVIKELLKRTAVLLAQKAQVFLKEGFIPFLEDFKHAMILNQDISFRDSKRQVHQGKGVDICEDGSFKMISNNGEILIFHSGELIE